jgi:hypothetical protein
VNEHSPVGKWRRAEGKPGPMIADNGLDILDPARTVARIDRANGSYVMRVYVPASTLHEPAATITDSRSTYLRRIGTALLHDTGTLTRTHEVIAAIARHTANADQEVPA